MLADPDVEMVDICTPTDTHLPLSLARIAPASMCCRRSRSPHGRPCLRGGARGRRAACAPSWALPFAIRPRSGRSSAWIDDGTLGEISHIHGFEQNSQCLDPDFPLRQYSPMRGRDKLIPSSIIGYGSHLVDLMRWLGGEFESVAEHNEKFVPDRVVRGKPDASAIPVEDGTVAIVEYASGAQGILQTSYIAVGNYPGVEIRVYGSKGAAVARLVVEFGVAETLHYATADAVEFRKMNFRPDAPAAGHDLDTPWPELYYRNLVRFFVDEILEDRPQECTFFDGAKSQEIVDAIIAAHFERRWVDLPGVAA